MLINFNQWDFNVLELVELKCTVFYAMAIYTYEYSCLQKIITWSFYEWKVCTVVFLGRQADSKGGRKEGKQERRRKWEKVRTAERFKYDLTEPLDSNHNPYMRCLSNTNVKHLPNKCSVYGIYALIIYMCVFMLLLRRIRCLDYFRM